MECAAAANVAAAQRRHSSRFVAYRATLYHVISRPWRAIYTDLGRHAGGRVRGATNQTLDFEKLDLRMEPGDVLAVALQTASSTATTNVSLNWHGE